MQGPSRDLAVTEPCNCRLRSTLATIGMDRFDSFEHHHLNIVLYFEVRDLEQLDSSV